MASDRRRRRQTQIPPQCPLLQIQIFCYAPAVKIWTLIALATVIATVWSLRACNLQPWRGRDIAMICRGMDPLRLWPMPPLFPYPEDPITNLTAISSYDNVDP